MTLSFNLVPGHPGGLWLANPVLTASGTCGYGVELGEIIDIQRLGAIVCKGITLHPREGNPQPRVAETPAGLLNSIGLQNIGVEALIRDMAPLWASWRVPVIVNIAGESAREYREVARRLDGVPGVAGIEVNISCPNVAQGGMEFGAKPRPAARVVAAVRKATGLPLLVKLTPNGADMPAVARAVAEAGADALTVMNTILGLAIDTTQRKPFFPAVKAGLSGPAIKPIALYHVYEVARAVSVPVVGCGGIASATDALEFLMAGATAVQVGTATLVNPKAPLEVLEGLEAYLKQKNIADVRELVGAAAKA